MNLTIMWLWGKKRISGLKWNYSKEDMTLFAVTSSWMYKKHSNLRPSIYLPHWKTIYTKKCQI
jgi:hypothetical protein